MKKSKLTKTLSILCALCLLFSVFAQGIVVSAADEAVPQGVLESAQENVQEEQVVEDSQASTPKNAKDLLPPLSSKKTLPAQTGDGENPWSLGLVFYDSAVDNGQTPLTESNWNASHLTYDQEETRIITIFIHYKNNSLDKTYEPGELNISIPNIFYYLKDLSYSAKFGANYENSGYQWSLINNPYSPYSESLIFSNAETLGEYSNFEGDIEIEIEYNSLTHRPEPYEDSCERTSTYKGQATLKEKGSEDPLVVSNEISFKYERAFNHPWQRYQYTLEKRASQVENAGDLSENADKYYWVRYEFDFYEYHPSYPWIGADGLYVTDSFPEDCLVFDRDSNLMSPTQGDEYKIMYDYGLSSVNVAYPKDNYKEENGNLIVRNEAVLRGTYKDRTEEEDLATDDVTINLADYSFNYPQGNYDVSKENSDPYQKMRYQDIVGDNVGYQNKVSWRIRPVATYSGKKMDVEFGDDLLLYENKDHENVKMEDDDYCFRQVGLGTIKYNVELYVRYAGQNDYELYKSFNKNEYIISNFTREEHVVGYYFLIKDMTTSLNTNSSCSTEFFMTEDEIPESGTLYNFSYIKSYLVNDDGEKVWVNQPERISYSSEFIADIDQERYGEYRQRNIVPAKAQWEYYDPHAICDQRISKKLYNGKIDVSEEIFTGDYKIIFSLYADNCYEEPYKDYYHPEERISFFGIYDLLPAGVDLEATKDELLSSLTCRTNHGTVSLFDSDFNKIELDEFIEMLKERADLKVTPNWRNTGRTHIALRFNFSDNPFYFFKTNSDSEIHISFIIPFSINSDSLLEYGNTYVNRAYSEVVRADGERLGVGLISDDGLLDPQELDINESGELEYRFKYASEEYTITYVDASHQSLQKTVMTPNTTKYEPLIANANPGEEYTYQLCIRTGVADITNLVVYDSVERYILKDDSFIFAPGENEYWQGSFEGVDTSHPEGKGYTIRVWYSTSDQPGKLGEDISWQEYTDATDKSTVRSLAFEYLDSNGDPAVIPANSLSRLYVKMKAPDTSYDTKLAYNGSYCDWIALDTFGNPVDYITGINSNIVKVSLFEPTTFEVEKEWFGDSILLRPAAVFVQLKRNGEDYGEPFELNAQNNWKHIFTNLPKYDDNHNAYTYSVEELPVDGYISYLTQEEGSNSAILTNIPTTTANITKIWKDDNNKNNTRPDSVVVQLYQTIGETTSKVEGKTLTLSDDNEWSDKIEDLPKYTKDRVEIKYSFKEIEVPEGYEVSISEDGLTITNTIKGKVSVPVEKKWIGTPNSAVSVELLANGIAVKGVILNADNNWKHTFENLDKYDSDGVEIQYTVREVDGEAYSPKITGNMSDGFVITNISPETLDIPVEKKWVGPAAEAVTIKLLADNEEIDSIDLNDSNSWKHTFKDLRKYDSNDGHEIVYDVEEVPVTNYEGSRSGNAEEGFVFTNTITEKVSVPVEKKWIGEADTSVTVELLADGTKVSEIVLNVDNNWKHTFENLEKYKDGVEIQYTVREVDGEAYSAKITGNMSDGFVITNISPETLDIPVEKKWVGDAAKSVTIRLLADGKEISTIKLDKSNDWKYIFKDLPKYDSKDGHEIKYTITEDAVSGYNSSITGDMEKGFVVTNTKITPPPSDTPKTSDESHLLFYLLTIILSGVGLTLAFLFGRKARLYKR